jgi:hypothetical protein
MILHVVVMVDGSTCNLTRPRSVSIAVAEMFKTAKLKVKFDRFLDLNIT